MAKFVITNPINDAGMELLENEGDYYLARNSNPNNYLDKMEDAECLIVSIASCDKNVIENSPNLKVIGRTGVGYDSVDVSYATSKGIPVVITPGANSRSVAEAAIASVFALSKNMIKSNQLTRNGDWDLIRNSESFFEIKDKTIGIVGLGHIGKIVSELAQANNMKVIWYDPYVSEDDDSVANKYGTKIHDFKQILEDSDFLTLHMPLTEDTKYLISLKELELMKTSSFLINLGRGGLVNEKDLLYALDNDLISGAAIDTFETEPIGKDYQLLKSDKIIVSPHSASQAIEAQERVAKMCVEGCLAIMRGEKWAYVADKSVYDHERWN